MPPHFWVEEEGEEKRGMHTHKFANRCLAEVVSERARESASSKAARSFEV